MIFELLNNYCHAQLFTDSLNMREIKLPLKSVDSAIGYYLQKNLNDYAFYLVPT